MKTIKTLLQDFLKILNTNPRTTEESKIENPGQGKPPEKPQTGRTSNNNHNKTNNVNNINNETHAKETHQTPGDTGMAYPDSPSTYRDAEEPKKQQTTHESALKAAYERGVKDGRNAQIEERYFPRQDDGVPHFHGNPTKAGTTSTLFSIAREA